MIFQRKMGIALMSLMASAAFVPAQAQDAAPEDSGGIPDIIVTAQKRAQSINDVGLTITALGGEDLQKQGIQKMSDLARVVPGLSFADSDHGTPIFTLRGVGFSDNSISNYPTTSVYVDEVPLPFAVMTAHANLDVERVEVLKGPQGTLFGQNSTGGAINYIAAKPTKEVAAGVDVTVGRFGQGEANGFVSGPLSDTLGMRLSGQYGYGNGWQKSYTRDDTNGKRNYINGRLLTVWDPTENLKIQLNLNGWRDRSDPLAAQMAGVKPQFDGSIIGVPGLSFVHPRAATYPFARDKPGSADWSTGVTRPRGDRWQYQGALRGDLDVTDNITLTSITSYTKFHTDQTFDLDGTDLELYGFHVRGNIKSFSQELRLAGGAGTAFNWVIGANYEKSKTAEYQTQYYRDSTTSFVGFSSTAAEDAFTKKRNYAFFASGDYEVVPGVTLKAGGRYTNSRQTMDQCNHDTGDGTINAAVAFLYDMFHPGVPFPAAIGDCTTLDPVTFEPSRFLDTLKEDNFSWRVGVDYKVNRDLLLYATVAKGYKAGGWPTTGAFLLSSYQAVKQESLLDYEAGFKAQLLDRRLSLNGAAFWYEYRDKQLLGRIPDIVFGSLPALVNIPKSRVKGAELEMSAVPIEGLQLSGSVIYLDAKVTEYSGLNAAGAPDNFAGSAMPFTSKWQYIASFDYTLPTDGGIKPFFGATLTGRSSATAIIGDADTLMPRAGFRSKVPVAELFDLPGHAMLDVRAGVEAPDGDWRLTVWGRNITDEYSITNVIEGNDALGRYPGPTATYGVTFAYKFGS